MQWDKLVGGLRWCFDTDERLMAFQIEGEIPETAAFLKDLQGQPKPYDFWVSVWHKSGLFPQQAFGMDMPRDVKEKDQEAVEVVRGALGAGYTTFDTAKLYGTSGLIAQAGPEKLGQLRIIHKVKADPESEDVVQQLVKDVAAEVESIPGAGSRVLMLHEIPPNMETTKACMAALSEKAGKSKWNVEGLGLSNVSIDQLKALCEYAAQSRLLPIRFVQNRFSPYMQDEAVREYCAEHGITYMGYGLFGSASIGECEGGDYALPLENLLVLQDKGFLALAKELNRDPRQLLLAWASQKGVTTVVYSGNHAKANMEALRRPLTEEEMHRVEALFTFGAQTSSPLIDDDDALDELYNSIKNPAVWRIFDQVFANQKARDLIIRLVERSHEAALNPSEAITNAAWNLVRLVTSAQSQVATEKEQAREMNIQFDPDPWDVRVVEALVSVAERLDEPGVLAGFHKWTQGDFMHAEGAAQAIDKVKEIPDQKLTRLSFEDAGALFTHIITSDGEHHQLDDKRLQEQLGELGCSGGEVLYNEDAPTRRSELVTIDAKGIEFQQLT